MNSPTLDTAQWISGLTIEGIRIVRSTIAAREQIGEPSLEWSMRLLRLNDEGEETTTTLSGASELVVVADLAVFTENWFAGATAYSRVLVPPGASLDETSFEALEAQLEHTFEEVLWDALGLLVRQQAAAVVIPITVPNRPPRLSASPTAELNGEPHGLASSDDESESSGDE